VTIRVVLVDDAAEIRQLVRTALRFRGVFTVVGEAQDGAEALEVVEQLQPDIVVLDLGLPDLAGQEVLSGLRARSPQSKVVIFSGTMPAEAGEIVRRVEGYALKDTELDYLVELLETLGSAPAGQTAVHLPALLTSAGTARAFTRETLAGWKVTDVIDDTLLVVTELVNNAVMHARSECHLRLSVNSTAVRVEVIDRSAQTPEPLTPSSTRDHGRGLHLVDALTAAWGVEPVDDSSKMVWAELRRGEAVS
jgi:CheY-like chemotaxis protein